MQTLYNRLDNYISKPHYKIIADMLQNIDFNDKILDRDFHRYLKPYYRKIAIPSVKKSQILWVYRDLVSKGLLAENIKLARYLKKKQGY